MRSFVALMNFSSRETKSDYAEGLTYTVRDGNRYLNALAEVWVLEGKVKFLHDPHAQAIVAGAGVVSDPPPPVPLTMWEQVKEWFKFS